MKPHWTDPTLPTVTAPPSPADAARPAASGTPQPPEQPPPRGPRPTASSQLRDPHRYQVLGEHGRGGLGRVSRAHDLELDRDVAIKELLSRNDVREARFVREAMITARLEHPGIVPVHEAGRWPDGTPFYAMKLVSGRPLCDLISERTTVEQRIGLLHHVIAVADAIAYAHGRNIIHRDLKPANVIVGDFGETVVIDWGLAKDLTASDELPTSNDEASPPSPDSNLTIAGAVLGTPSYMAPEQERGEPVDQRADVFAIGAMLWELCSLQRVPPADTRQRHRMLRRAGVDKDLATIIDKTLAPEPARRYPDAGALAADLKAFKSGARIAARSYSLFALLSHWTRRHRALALSVTAAPALAAIGIFFYIRDITDARDQAEAARVTAESHRQIAESGRAEIVLQHSELLLHSDPTAAVAAVAAYQGDDEVRRLRLIAEARGRGVASAVLPPHSDTIWFLVGEDTGAVVSLGEDRTIRRTHGDTSVTLANDVSINDLFDYATEKRLLAYATSASSINILDLATLATTHLDTSPPAAISISREGTHIAILDIHSVLTIWSIASGSPIWKERLVNAIDVQLITAGRLLVTERAALRIVPFDGSPQNYRPLQDYPRGLDSRPDRIIAGDNHGTLTLFSSTLDATARLSVCHRRINAVKFVPRTDLATFACQDGLAGIVRIAASNKELVELDTFPTLGAAFSAVPDETGHWIVVKSDSDVCYLYNTETRLVHRYEGQGARLSHIAPPRIGFRSILAGDVNGTVRVWPLPPTSAKVVLKASGGIFDISFASSTSELITAGADGVVRRINAINGNINEFRETSESRMITRVLVSSDSKLTVSLSSGGVIRVWRNSDGALLRTFAGHGSEAADAGYIESGRRIVSVGVDGRLLAWTPDGTDEALLFKSARPLVALEVLHHNSHSVVADSNGSVWDVAPSGSAQQVHTADGALTTLRAAPDGQLVAVGTERGTVTIYRTVDWTIRHKFTAGRGIRQIAFDPGGRDLVIASEDGRVHIIALDARRTLPWRQVPVAARDVAYSPDGEVIAFVCADGGTWFYSVRDNDWEYARDHFADTVASAFSSDGRWFATSDRSGVVTVRDIVPFGTAHVYSRKKASHQ